MKDGVVIFKQAYQDGKYEIVVEADSSKRFCFKVKLGSDTSDDVLNAVSLVGLFDRVEFDYIKDILRYKLVVLNILWNERQRNGR